MIKISVVINTRNEEKNIARAIASVKGVADEVVVVDMDSSDKTKSIARKKGAKVYAYKNVGYVEPARNYAFSKAKGEWILILDADEEITSSLGRLLKKIVKEDKVDYCTIPRKNIIFGKWMNHSRWWPDYNVRFFRKGHVRWGNEIHSVPETFGKGKDIEAKERLAIVHHNYDTLDQYIERLNRYTSIQAKELHSEKYKFHWRDLIRKSLSEFVNRYFAGEGYKDGLHGLALSILQAFSEVAVYLKVWQLQGFGEKNISLKKVTSEIKSSQKEINYWSAHSLVGEFGGFKNRVKRKLKI